VPAVRPATADPPTSSRRPPWLLRALAAGRTTPSARCWSAAAQGPATLSANT